MTLDTETRRGDFIRGSVNFRWSLILAFLLPLQVIHPPTPNIMTKDHPYYPVGLDLPGYYPPLRTFAQTTGLFFAVCAALAVAAIVYARGVKHFSTFDKFLFCWWILTGAIHLVLEGGFAVMPAFGADTTGNIMAELCELRVFVLC